MGTAAETGTTGTRTAGAWRVARRLRYFGLLLLLGLRTSALGCGQQGELECEELAQHMLNCCGHSGNLDCVAFYEERVSISAPGCGGGNYIDIRRTDPDFSGEAARCVRGATCELLQQAGACDVQSWLGPEQCSTTQREQSAYSPYGGGYQWYNFTVKECSTPRQVGLCEAYRPMPACRVLSQLGCPPP